MVHGGPVPDVSGGAGVLAYMMDPLSLGASAAGKIGSAVAASYARGRDERRQVYRRFQEAVVVYVMQVRDSRISPQAMGLAPDQRKPYIDAFMKATTELALALYEVRLVGNDGPRAAAEALRMAVGESFDAAFARREALTDEEADKFTRAMEAFTEACRRDLWYQPPWWQIWRVSWWKARWQHARGPAPGPVIQVAPTGAPSPGIDVVFGIHQSINMAGSAIDAVVLEGLRGKVAHNMALDAALQAEEEPVTRATASDEPVTRQRADNSDDNDGDASRNS